MPIPSLSNSPTKENIIELLSHEWPLTAKKIYRRVIKNYKTSITYQGVHKSLRELIDNSILQKNKEGYFINKEWVVKMGEFSHALKDKLEHKAYNSQSKTFRKITFNSHREFIKFHIELVEELIRKEGKVKMIFYYRHVPYPHVLSNEEIKIMKNLMPKIKWTIISKKATPMDKWNAKQWKKMGVKIRLGSEIPTDRLIILNDYILNVYVPKESISTWDKSYSVKNISDFDVHFTNEAILNQKFKTTAFLFKDKEIARLLSPK